MACQAVVVASCADLHSSGVLGWRSTGQESLIVEKGSKHALEALVTEDLATQTSELNQLSNSDPHPGNEKVKNIEAAKEQDKKLQEFVAEARKTFVPIDYPTNLDSGQLKLLLDTVIDELHRKADGKGVKLQPEQK